MIGEENQVDIIEELVDIPEEDGDAVADSVQPTAVVAEVMMDESDADSVGAPSAVSSDDTDYQAAFMDLRSTYASKERECEALKAESEEHKNQYLRLAADFENFRRRNQQEKESLEVQAKISTVTELLSVVDNFERARSFVKPQTEGETTIHNSYQGVYKDMVAQLKKIGVAPMRAEGKEFDPNLHEALMSEPTADHPEGTVMQELIRGYMMGDRVIRHARVKVAAAPEEAADEN
jgi:molecular chaperone GrpE